MRTSSYSVFIPFLTLASDEDLIKYAWPQDIWFHVDKLSSAHVYLRLPENIPSWDAIPEVLLQDCAQLVKANSIEGASYLSCTWREGGLNGGVREQEG